MKLHLKYLQFGLSLTIIAVAYLAFQLLHHNQNDPVNSGISLYLLVLVLSYTAIVAAVVILLFRIDGKLVKPASFYYNFIGTLNFCFGSSYFVLLFLERLDATSLIRFSINLILGTIIIADIILWEESQDNIS